MKNLDSWAHWACPVGSGNCTTCCRVSTSAATSRVIRLQSHQIQTSSTRAARTQEGLLLSELVQQGLPSPPAAQGTRLCKKPWWTEVLAVGCSSAALGVLPWVPQITQTRAGAPHCHRMLHWRPVQTLGEGYSQTPSVMTESGQRANTQTPWD